MSSASSARFSDTVPQTVPMGLRPGAVLDLDLNLDDIPDLDIDIDLDFNTSATGESVELDLLLPDEGAVVAPAAAPVSDSAHEVTRPFVSTVNAFAAARRVLVVSADADERMYLRARMAMGRLVWVDEATSTTQAVAAMADLHYVLVFVNLDSSVIDGWALVKQLRQIHPQALLVATAQALGPLPWWRLGDRWRARRLRERASAQGFDAALAKPLSGRLLATWVERVVAAPPRVAATKPR